jgi:hypothetical protein
MKSYLNIVGKFLLLFFFLWCIQIALVLLIKELLPQKIALKKAGISMVDKHIFILGNSHPECALNDSLLPANYLNVSSSGEPLFYTCMKANKLIKAQVVDTLIIEFDNTALHTIGWVLDDNRLLTNFKTYFFSMQSPDIYFLFQHNPLKTIRAIAVLNLMDVLKVQQIEGGFRYLNRNKLTQPEAHLNDKFASAYSRQIQLKNFESLFNLIQQNPAIPIYLIRLPMHPHVYLEQNALFLDLVSQLTRYSNIHFIDFHKTLDIPDSCFADSTHLNYKGARLFTPYFKQKIRQVGR